ncbi:MAG: hypothetical protein HXS48_09385 [Theionarchaea archaeon]|nr:hypothetical protein [Theionarchaea archaeon]
MPETSLSHAALLFWNLKFDPFTTQPLMFNVYKDYDRLIKTSSIKAMKDIATQLVEDILSKKIIIKGNRGSGKTTAMRYLYKEMVSEETKSIFCEIMNLQDFSTEELRYSIHSAILLEIAKAIQSDNKIACDYNLKTVRDTVVWKSLPLIDSQICVLIELIFRYYEKLVLFIDNIDKPSTERISLWLEYFSTSQGFYESLISRGTTFLLIALQPFVAARLKQSKQTAYLIDSEVGVSQWSFIELNRLLESRLKLACNTPENFRLSSYFDSDARLALYISNDFNPRWTMQGARQTMQSAYELSQDKTSKVLCRPIKKDFCNKYRDVMKGAIPTPDFRRFEIINDLVVRRHLNAYDKVKRCLQHNEASAFSLIEALISIWESGTYTDSQIVYILTKEELIARKRKTTSISQKDMYSVDPLVKSLIDFLDDSFYGDPDSIRYYLLTSSM